MHTIYRVALTFEGRQWQNKSVKTIRRVWITTVLLIRGVWITTVLLQIFPLAHLKIAPSNQQVTDFTCSHQNSRDNHPLIFLPLLVFNWKIPSYYNSLPLFKSLKSEGVFDLTLKAWSIWNAWQIEFEKQFQVVTFVMTKGKKSHAEELRA